MSIISRAYFVFRMMMIIVAGGLPCIGTTWLCTVSESRPFINNVVPLPYICQLFSPKFFKSTNYI